MAYSTLPPTTVLVGGVCLCLSLGGCGFATGGAVAAASGGGRGSANAPATPAGLLVLNPKVSPATIRIVMTDAEADVAEVEFFYSAPSTGGVERALTKIAQNPVRLTTARGGIAHEISWGFAGEDGINTAGLTEKVRLLAKVRAGVDQFVTQDLGNDAPSVSAPSAFPSSAVEYSGNTDITFKVADSSSDKVQVRVEYNDDPQGGFPDSGWKTARPAATPGSEATPEFGLVDVQASPSGNDATFRWDTLFDLDGWDDDVRVRVTAADEFRTGTSVTTAAFRVDNNLPPQAALESDSFFLGVKNRGNIPIPFKLYDAESDPVRVLVQWRDPADPWPVLPATADDLRDLLLNPARASERRERQVAVEAPIEFRGRIGALAGMSGDQVCLPSLATENGELVVRGLAGRDLDIMRPTDMLRGVGWPSSVLNGPVAGVAEGDAGHLLVLDRDNGGWRLCRVDLHTGSLVHVVGTGSGQPKALAIDPSRSLAFVASSVDIRRIDLRNEQAIGVVAHGLLDGPRGMTALGRAIVLVTGDDRLVRCDFETSSSRPVLGGLGEPWGVVSDPSVPGRVYLSERSANRVTEVDLATLARQPLGKVRSSDVGILGTLPFPSPRALVLEEMGTRLLVMTQFGGAASLRVLDLRSPFDFDADGFGDPFVRRVPTEPVTPESWLATGQDALRVLGSNPGSLVMASGGVAQRLEIVRQPRDGNDPRPYNPTTQVVTLVASAHVPIGSWWRIKANAGQSSPQGTSNAFVWDTTAVPDPAQVQVRVLPIDGDAGADAVTVLAKSLRPRFDSAPTVLGGLDGIAVADLDGDGDCDVASVTANGITLNTQTAPGVFTPVQTITTSTASSFLIAADVDGDGRQDLVGSGGIHFREASGSYTTVALPLTALQSAAVADLDGDGDLDIVDIEGPDIVLFSQTGARTFSSVASIPAAGLSRGVVTIADVDGDGFLDFVLARQAAPVRICYRSAPWTYQLSVVNSPIATTPPVLLGSDMSVTCADLDADGDIDIAVANHDPSNPYVGGLWLAFQSTPRIFLPTPYMATDGSITGVAAGDLDGDGDMDLVATDQFVTFLKSQALRMFFQTKPGVFTQGPLLPVSVGQGVRQVVARDIDGDGRIDIATGPGQLHLQVGKRMHENGVETWLGFEQGIFGFQIADLDSDGDTDLGLTTNFSGRLFLQIASGVTNEVNPNNAPLSFVAAADMDGDGVTDFVRLNDVRYQTQPGVFLQSAPVVPAPWSAKAAADFNSDGIVDLLIVNGLQLAVLAQRPVGVFSIAGPSVLLDEAPDKVVATDLDGDGRIDFAVRGASGTSLRQYLQTAFGGFTAGSSLPCSGASLFATDTNGDGRNDIVAGAYVHLQDAAGGFTPTLLPAGVSNALAVEDIDDDNCMDIVGSDASGNVMLLRQRPSAVPGAVVFAVESTFTFEGGGARAAADMDGDGDIDVFVVRFLNSFSFSWGGR